MPNREKNRHAKVQELFQIDKVEQIHVNNEKDKQTKVTVEVHIATSITNIERKQMAEINNIEAKSNCRSTILRMN